MRNSSASAAAEDKPFRLSRARTGELVLTLLAGATYSEVQVVCAAPLSHPNRYICFLDSSGQEICMIKELSELLPEDRLLVDEELQMRYITTVIRRIISGRREGSTLYWQAETNRGLREVVVQNCEE